MVLPVDPTRDLGPTFLAGDGEPEHGEPHEGGDEEEHDEEVDPEGAGDVEARAYKACEGYDKDDEADD